MATPIRKTHFLIALVASLFDGLKRALHESGVAGAVTGTSGAEGTGAVTGSTGATQPSATAEAVAGTGFATAGQVVTTTESFTAALNQYAGCWLITATQPPCLIASHPAAAAAPLALTVYGAAPTTDAGTWKILSGVSHLHAAGTLAGPSHTHAAGTYSAGAGTPAVHYDRAEYAVTAAAASDADTLLTLTRALAIAFVTHLRDTVAHTVADSANDPDDTLTPGEIAADAQDTTSCITLLNTIKAAYNAHRGESGVHPLDDSGHAITSPDATDLASANTLANELRTDFNAHMADGQLPASWRVVE